MRRTSFNLALRSAYDSAQRSKVPYLIANVEGVPTVLSGARTTLAWLAAVQWPLWVVYPDGQWGELRLTVEDCDTLLEPK